MENYIYLDNNANSVPTKEVISTYIKYSTVGNIDGNNKIAKNAKKKVEEFKQYLNDICELNDEYELILTSGATESNNSFIRMVVERSIKQNVKPHILISNVEHSSITQCCLDLVPIISFEEIPVSIQGDFYGQVDPMLLEKCITDNIRINRKPTLICIMSANNENGTINRVRELSSIAHKYDILFFSDCVQLFPRYPVLANKIDLDAFSISFHKLHGYAGIGLLAVRKEILTTLKSIMSGSRKYRSGTMNPSLIMSSFVATVQTFENRQEKTTYLRSLRSYLLSKLNSSINIVNVLDKYEMVNILKSNTLPTVIVCMIRNTKWHLPNTLFIANNIEGCCNIAIQNWLEHYNIIIGLGSACNNISGNVSYVVKNTVPENIRSSVIRVSLCDHNTEKEIDVFVKKYLEIILSKKGLSDDFIKNS